MAAGFCQWHTICALLVDASESESLVVLILLLWFLRPRYAMAWMDFKNIIGFLTVFVTVTSKYMLSF